MKKLMILCTMLFLVSCSKSAVEEASIVATDYEFTAYTPEEQSDSRTYVDAQMKLHWTKGDLVSIFHGMLEPLKFGFRGETGATSGTYYNVDGIFYAPDQSAPNNVAIYPYSADHLLDEDTRAVTLAMPAEQTYVEDSFGLGANTMIAITSEVNDLALYFKNVGTYLNVRLWGEQQTVKSITVMATGGEALSGKAIVTPTYGGDPTCVMADEAVSPSVKLVCEEVVTVDATEENPKSFWLVLPPVTMARGFTATIENADGDTQTFAIDRSITFARNKYNTLTRELAIEKQQVVPIATSTISYTTDDGNIVDLFTTEGFGAGYVSNIYDKENNIGTITFDGEITTIPAEAFLVCTNLTSVQIPNSVTTIAEKAFYGCNYMKKIIIPESVTQIKETAFEGCSGEAHIFCNINDKAFVGALFTKVILDDCVTSLGKSAFASCYNLKEVVLSKGITKLEYCTFIYCSSLEKIVNTDYITYIADGVFAETGIVNISLPNVDYIGERAFEHCSCLNEIQLSESMSHIGSGAFNHCSLLNKITIPEGITTLYKDTFNYCSKLEAISLPSTLTTLYGSFYGCTSINRVDIKNFEMWCNLEILQSDGYLGGCTPLEGSNGGDIYVNGDKLINATFSNNVTNIRDDLLMNCTSIESVTFGSRVSKIGSGAFNGCTNLSNIYLPKSIISIGASAFKNTSLSCVDIPAGVTIISAQTFSGCKQLKEANLPSTIREIGERAFNECVELSQLNLPTSVTAIGGGAFNNCKNITEINIPNNVKSIGEAAFAGLEKITSIVIPDGVALMPGTCFKGCVNLTNIILPNNIEKIGNWAFEDCKSLSSISLPESLIAIGQYAFSHCPISTITIPSNVSRIENSAFNNCPLIEMYCKPKKVPYIQGAMSSNLFRGIIYVPRASEELYKAEWSPMADRIVGYDFTE